jgi:hypothetical protein
MPWGLLPCYRERQASGALAAGGCGQNAAGMVADMARSVDTACGDCTLAAQWAMA